MSRRRCADDGANGVDPNLLNNTNSDVDTLVAAPDLKITKTGPVDVTPGASVSYSLLVENVGNQGSAGSTVSELVPDYTTFNAGASTAGWGCVPDGSAGSACTFGARADSGGWVGVDRFRGDR